MTDKIKLMARTMLQMNKGPELMASSLNGFLNGNEYIQIKAEEDAISVHVRDVKQKDKNVFYKMIRIDKNGELSYPEQEDENKPFSKNSIKKIESVIPHSVVAMMEEKSGIINDATSVNDSLKKARGIIDAVPDTKTRLGKLGVQNTIDGMNWMLKDVMELVPADEIVKQMNESVGSKINLSLVDDDIIMFDNGSAHKTGLRTASPYYDTKRTESLSIQNLAITAMKASLAFLDRKLDLVNAMSESRENRKAEARQREIERAIHREKEETQRKENYLARFTVKKDEEFILECPHDDYGQTRMVLKAERDLTAFDILEISKNGPQKSNMVTESPLRLIHMDYYDENRLSDMYQEEYDRDGFKP